MQEINSYYNTETPSNILEYSVSNFRDIQIDIQNRTKLINQYRTMIDKRIKIEIDYANRMRQFVQNLQNKLICNPTKSSEIYMNCLINSFKSDGDNLMNYKMRLTTQVEGLIESSLQQAEFQGKNIINSGISLEKQFQSHFQQMEKIKNKYFKKCFELRKQKQEYIIGYLSDMSFDKKNKLYLKIKQLEQRQYNPLQREFTRQLESYRQFSELYHKKMNHIIEKSSQVQNSRIQMMQNSFMILEIAKSQFGANMVNQNNSLLATLNEHTKERPDFLYASKQSIKAKSSKLTEVIDPNKYINILFTHIDSKITENLILYGSSEKHKKKLNESLIGEQMLNDKSPTTENQIQTTDQELREVQQISLCFRNIFSQTEQIDSAKVMKLQILMYNSFEARKSFILCLQKFRWKSKYEIPVNKIKYISDIMNSFLNQCYRQKDTYNSKLLMILSLTYHIKIDGQKVDLHIYIKDHKIWLDKDWWECALLESVFEETKVKKKIQYTNSITLWDIKGSGMKHSQSEHQMTFQHVVFNQLLYYITNMRLFNLPQDKIVEVVKKYVKYFNLTSSMISDIQVCLNTNKQTLSFIQISDNSQTKGGSSGEIKFKDFPTMKSILFKQF